jgi:hypothetical protein
LRVIKTKQQLLIDAFNKVKNGKRITTLKFK